MQAGFAELQNRRTSGCWAAARATLHFLPPSRLGTHPESLLPSSTGPCDTTQGSIVGCGVPEICKTVDGPTKPTTRTFHRTARRHTHRRADMLMQLTRSCSKPGSGAIGSAAMRCSSASKLSANRCAAACHRSKQHHYILTFHAPTVSGCARVFRLWNALTIRCPWARSVARHAAARLQCTRNDYYANDDHAHPRTFNVVSKSNNKTYLALRLGDIRVSERSLLELRNALAVHLQPGRQGRLVLLRSAARRMDKIAASMRATRARCASMMQQETPCSAARASVCQEGPKNKYFAMLSLCVSGF